MSEVNYLFIIAAAFVAAASPGPATLAIAATSMSKGRLEGVTLGMGIFTGSLFWSCAAAFGLSAVMYANAWLFEYLRYIGAGYLLYLAYKATCSSLKNETIGITITTSPDLLKTYLRGVAIHLTNPKAIFFFGSLYSIGIPLNTNQFELLKIIGVVGFESLIIFQTYAFIFSISSVCSIYTKLRRWFEALFALIFGVAGFKVLTTKLE